MPAVHRFLTLSTALSALLFSLAASAQQATPAAPAPTSTPAPAPAVTAPAEAAPLDPIAQLKKDLHAVEDDKGITVTLLGDVLYDFNQSNLRMEASPTLVKLADLIRKTRKPVQISGFTDDKGNAEYNKKLSELRAKALRASLIQRGIRAGSIKAAGYGKDRPKAANTNPDGTDNPKGRETNRRMEVLISKA